MGNVPAKEDQEINKLKDHGGGRRSANGNNSDPLRPKNSAVDSAPGVERHQIMTALKALRPTYEEEKLQVVILFDKASTEDIDYSSTLWMFVDEHR